MPFAQMNIQEQWFDLNGNPLSGGVLKAYEPGDVNTSISIFITDTGGSPQASITLNAEGKYEVSGNEVLPYIDREHMWALFSNSTDAAANANPFAGFYDNVPLGGSTSDVSSDTVALMVANTSLSVGQFVSTRGYTSIRDGGDNDYEIVASGTGTDDGGSFIDLVTHQARAIFPRRAVNIKQFGGSPSATAVVNKAAFQAANDYLATLGGGDLLIPTGTSGYDLPNTTDNTPVITLSGDVNLVGEGEGSLITNTNPTAAGQSPGRYSIFRLGNRSKVTKLKFSGTNVDHAGYTPVDIFGVDDCLVQEIAVSGFGEGILCQDCDNIVVTNNHLTGTERWSMMFAKSANCKAIANRISGSVTNDGIKVNGNQYDDVTDYDNNYLLIKDNIISGCARDGIDMASGGDTVIIEGNLCRANSLNGIEIKAQVTSVTAQRISVKDNSCVSNTAHGIRIDDISKSEVISNLVESNGDEGIIAQNAILKTKISENRCISNGGNGIRFQGHVTVGISKDCVINDNQCIDNGVGDHGIQINDYVDGLTISGNECYQTSSGKTNTGIQIGGTTSITKIRIMNNFCPQDKLDNSTNDPISMGSFSGDNIYEQGNVTHTTSAFTFDANDATPSVSGGNHIYSTANSNPTTITTLDQGSFEMAPFTILFNDANTTVQHGTGTHNIKLNGAVNFVATSQSTLTVVCRNSRFIEIGRMET